MRIAVTGATGFIGEALVSHLSERGHDVIRFQQQSISGPRDRFFDVRSVDSIPDLSGIDALVHTAFIKYDRVSIPDSSEFNIACTIALQRACHRSRTRFIFLSCMSAHAAAYTHYGRHKYAIERQLDISRDLIFRAGVVLGHRGLFANIRSGLSKGLFTPLAGGGRQMIQTIALSDVCMILEKAINQEMAGSYAIATERIYTMRALCDAVALRLHKKPGFSPLSYTLVSIAHSIAESLKLKTGIPLEEMYALRDFRTFDTKEDLLRLGIRLKDMEETLDELMNEK